MISAIILALVWAAPTIPVDGYTGGLVADAVTVEGTASLRVTADTCRVVFGIAAKGRDADAALTQLKTARKRFSTAFRSVTGNSAAITFGRPVLARRTAMEGERGWFEAGQPAILTTRDFPKSEDDFDTWLSKIIQATAQADVVAGEVEGPQVFFEVTNPAAFEERLAAAALIDAKKRADASSKLLARTLLHIRAAYLPSGITADGKFVPFSPTHNPVVSKDLKVVITYTVQVAYALEL